MATYTAPMIIGSLIKWPLLVSSSSTGVITIDIKDCAVVDLFDDGEAIAWLVNIDGDEWDGEFVYDTTGDFFMNRDFVLPVMKAVFGDDATSETHGMLHTMLKAFALNVINAEEIQR